jgi:hypothetical protein
MSNIKFNDVVYCVGNSNMPLAFEVVALSETQALCQPILERKHNPKDKPSQYWMDQKSLSLNLSSVITLCSFNHDEQIASTVAEFTRVHHAW